MNHSEVQMQASPVFHDFDEYVHLPGWEHSEALQLSRGPMLARRWENIIEGMDISVGVTNASLQMRDIFDGDGITISGVVGGDETPTYMGTNFLEDGLMVWRPRALDAHHYTIPKGSIDFFITIPQVLADVMGWEFDHPILNLGSPNRLEALVSSLQMVQAAESAEGTALTRARSNLIVVNIDRIMMNCQPIDTTNQVWKSHIEAFKLFEAAAALLDPELDTGRSFSAKELAKELGISRRSLFSSFRRWPGMGPTTYLTTLRLHRLRNRLLRGQMGSTTVTEEALAVGFSHLGRLPSAYRDRFGELPSDTLKRGGKETLL